MQFMNVMYTISQYQKASTSRNAKPVSDAPTTTILALMVTFGSMVSFWLMWLSAYGAWGEVAESVRKSKIFICLINLKNVSPKLIFQSL